MGELGYVPSSAARTMRSHRTGLVGLVTGAISGPQAAGGASGLPDLQIVQGIQRVLAEQGMTLLISDTGGDAERIPPSGAHAARASGRGPVLRRRPPPARRAAAGGAASGWCWSTPSTTPARPCVLPDDQHGQRQLTTALIDAGHRRIGFLTLPDHARRLPAAARRLPAGARRGRHRASTRRSSSTRIATGRPQERGGAVRRRSTRCWRSTAPPTVLCCGNDRLAVTVYGILRARGIAVPEEMSVAGYDDYRVISETLYPQLTTMELPYRPHGRGGGAADARRPARRTSRCPRHAGS